MVLEVEHRWYYICNVLAVSKNFNENLEKYESSINLGGKHESILCI